MGGLPWPQAHSLVAGRADPPIGSADCKHALAEIIDSYRPAEGVERQTFQLILGCMCLLGAGEKNAPVLQLIVGTGINIVAHQALIGEGIRCVGAEYAQKITHQLNRN